MTLQNYLIGYYTWLHHGLVYACKMTWLMKIQALQLGHSCTKLSCCHKVVLHQLKKKKGGGGGGSFVVYCGEFLMPGNRPCVPVSHVSPVGSVHLSHKLLFTCSMLHLGSEGTNPRWVSEPGWGNRALDIHSASYWCPAMWVSPT